MNPLVEKSFVVADAGYVNLTRGIYARRYHLPIFSTSKKDIIDPSRKEMTLAMRLEKVSMSAEVQPFASPSSVTL